VKLPSYDLEKLIFLKIDFIIIYSPSNYTTFVWNIFAYWV